jgi:hypothetical protein
MRLPTDLRFTLPVRRVDDLPEHRMRLKAVRRARQIEKLLDTLEDEAGTDVPTQRSDNVADRILQGSGLGVVILCQERRDVAGESFLLWPDRATAWQPCFRSEWRLFHERGLWGRDPRSGHTFQGRRDRLGSLRRDRLLGEIERRACLLDVIARGLKDLRARRPYGRLADAFLVEVGMAGDCRWRANLRLAGSPESWRRTFRNRRTAGLDPRLAERGGPAERLHVGRETQMFG